MDYPCRLPGANRRDRRVPVPEGFAPKTEGYCREGDRFWDRNLETWVPVVDAGSHRGAPVSQVLAVIARSELGAS